MRKLGRPSSSRSGVVDHATTASRRRTRASGSHAPRGSFGCERGKLGAHLLRLLGDDEDLPEPLLACLVAVRDTRKLLERLVEADDATLWVDHAEEARRVVDDRADEVAFPLELGGQLLELGELARDQDRLVAVLHDPGLEVALDALDDHAVVASHGRRFDRLVDPVDDLVGDLLWKDVVGTAAEELFGRDDQIFGMTVEIEVRAVAVETEHEVRGRVEQGAVASFALAQRLDRALSREREARRSADRVDQVTLLFECRIVDERRHDLSLVLDEGRRPPFACGLLSEIEGLAVDADPPVRVRKPDGELEVRVVERVRDRIAELAQAVRAQELDDEHRHGGAGKADLQQAGEERERYRRKGEEDEPPDDIGGGLGDERDHDRETDEEERRRRRDEDGRQRPAERRRGGPPAPEEHPRCPEEDEPGAEDGDHADGGARVLRVPDCEGVARAAGAVLRAETL